MRRERSDISLLLTILVLFSASIGLLHGFKIVSISATAETDTMSLSQQDIFDLIFPQLISDNMDKAAAALSKFDFPSQLKVVQQIMRGNRVSLSNVQKITLLAAIAAQTTDPSRKAELFTLFRKLFPSMPVFALIVDQYPAVVTSLIEWAKNENMKKILQAWKYTSVANALAHNNVSLLTNLYTHGLRLTPLEASNILDRVVKARRDVAFVPLLVRQFGAEVTYSDDGKRTPLIKAVEMNNPDMVRALIAVKADPQYAVDASFGSAITIAEQTGLSVIEKILRDY
ncbi:MAG: hypothetical protein ACD_64C00114G0002 [uncultured bacterium]|nr:MAG: hypothetical protein ACD_64C00114G0002 [uncultured bacterium]